MPSEENRRITDVGTLKALAHPLRADLYRLLCLEGVATASQLAEHVDEAVSLVSYHLRKLAQHGLIEEAQPQTGDARERWWQPASDGVSIRDADFRGEPGKAAAHLAATRLFHDQRARHYSRYLDERPTWSAEWNAAVMDNESWMRLTPAELTALKEELVALLRRYDEQGRAAEAEGGTEEREHVALYMYGFPFRV
ncbi:helix-turn-helix domain-containing protein [Streptomyces actinomycinicus]|uniref:Helix-turn-helix domain-containing protein n=1 Tax=Streptomyces actinomycinicus TaxID=1695166 RepID=A0A937EM46_9ACTN|nr:helix-turn-helix domain-containing protein [Streptomyces actinomycinicus]MBL1084780.1 helix-turn-helix domain-containing protein [Streptomyces actinomycinicus]